MMARSTLRSAARRPRLTAALLAAALSAGLTAAAAGQDAAPAPAPENAAPADENAAPRTPASRVTRACSGGCADASADAPDDVRLWGAASGDQPATVLDPAFFAVAEALGPVPLFLNRGRFAGACGYANGVCLPPTPPGELDGDAPPAEPTP